MEGEEGREEAGREGELLHCGCAMSRPLKGKPINLPQNEASLSESRPLPPAHKRSSTEAQIKEEKNSNYLSDLFLPLFLAAQKILLRGEKRHDLKETGQDSLTLLCQLWRVGGGRGRKHVEEVRFLSQLCR